MPKALGEFGAASKSDVTNKIMNVCLAANNPLSFKDIWKHVANDVNSLTELRPIIENLLFAEKIIKVGNGYMAKRQVIQEKSNDRTVDFSLLTHSEREYLS
jgi:septation ring formation regulator EzrA